MGKTKSSVVDLEQEYMRNSHEISIETFLRGLDHSPDDEELGEIIETDGRERLRRGLTVDLDRYLVALPDLKARSNPLDAALEVSLRSLARADRIDSPAVERLIADYPELESAIHEAAIMNNALWSTTGLREQLTSAPVRKLPSSFGPELEDRERRYTLLEFLGDGAAGHVYLANDRLLAETDHQALVAVKILRSEFSTPLTRLRMTDEATRARRIDHPNVIRVLDRGTSPMGEGYIVTEYVDGGDLAEFLVASGGRVSPRMAARLVAAIARGVQAAHNAGLVHCDLKPGNIMLTSDGQPKVADFGVAARLGGQKPGTMTESVGNQAFSSPEQYRMEEGCLTPPSDVYAIGGILYRLISGELPNGATVPEIAARHANNQGGRPLPEGVPGLDRDLRSICDHALAYRPEDRYDSAGSMADDLEAWIGFEPIKWTRPSPPRVARLWVRRRPLAAALCAALSLSIAVGAYAGVTAIEQARLQNARLAHGLDLYSRVLKQVSEMGTARSDILPMLWNMIYVSGLDFMPVDSDTPGKRRALAAACEKLVKAAEAEGRGEHLDTLLYKSGWAYWYVAMGELDGRVDELRSLKESWSRLLDPDDRWLGYMDAIIACARVQEIEMAVQSNNGSLERSPVELDQHITTLREQEAILEGIDQQSPLHFLVVEALARAYAPSLLDDPALWAELNDQLSQMPKDASMMESRIHDYM